MRQILDSLEKQLKVGEKFDTKVNNILLKTFVKIPASKLVNLQNCYMSLVNGVVIVFKKQEHYPPHERALSVLWKLNGSSVSVCCIGELLKSYCINITAWKVSKYGVISGPCFPVLGLNTELQYGDVWRFFVI